jgi:hypothetical protein
MEFKTLVLLDLFDIPIRWQFITQTIRITKSD